MPFATATAGQVSDYKGAALLMDAIDALPEARALLADRAYDADWFRDALRTRARLAGARAQDQPHPRRRRRGQ